MTLAYKAELTAARAAQYIYAPDAPWKYDTDQLAAISEIRTHYRLPHRTAHPRCAWRADHAEGRAVGWPTFARRAPIYGRRLGVGVAEVSVQPAAVADGGHSGRARRPAVLAIGAYFAFAVLPLDVHSIGR